MKQKREHIYCDYCDPEHEIAPNQAVSVNACVGAVMDGAGGQESIFLTFDVCPLAAAALFSRMARVTDSERVDGMVEWLKEHIERAEIR